MQQEKIKETARQIAVLVAKSGATYPEVSEIFKAAQESLFVVADNSGIVYRDSVPYERRPYAREYTPVKSADT